MDFSIPKNIAALLGRIDEFIEREIKPLQAQDDNEDRELARAAAKEKRAAEMGTQIHAGSNYRRVVELGQSAAIGTVKEVHVWVGTSGYSYPDWVGDFYPAGTRPGKMLAYYSRAAKGAASGANETNAVSSEHTSARSWQRCSCSR